MISVGTRSLKRNGKPLLLFNVKNILDWFKRNYLFIIPLILLAIFIASIWDRNFYIGGDIVLPLHPKTNIDKSIFLWEGENRGLSFFKYTLLIWQIPFYLFALVGIAPDIGIKLFDILILVIGFIFTYLLYRLLLRDTKYNSKELGLLCGLLFSLNASSITFILPGTIYLSALPLCSYFVIKFLDTRKFSYILFFAISINIAYFAQLPQAKYIAIFLMNMVFILLIYLLTRKSDIKSLIIRLIILSVGTFLLSSVILIPFLFDSFRSGGTYNSYSQSFVTYDGDADLYSASLLFIPRFLQLSLINSTTELGRFLASRVFTLWTYILLILAVLPVFLVKTGKEKKIVYVLLAGFVFFIFSAKGSNPPFGEVYKTLLAHFFFFKLFRTTAIIAMGGVFFFSVLVTIAVFYLSKQWKIFFFIILIIHVLVFRGVYLGYNFPVVTENGKIQKGYSVPFEYYQMGKKLDNIPQDSKILSLPLDETYSYKDWGYIGTSIMYWITRKPFIHGRVAGFPGFGDNLVLQRMNNDESCYWIAINNIGYILNEKDSRIPYSLSQFNFPSKPILENTYFKLDKVNPKCFLPHIYAATDTFLFEGENNSIPDVSRFTKDKSDIVISLNDPVNKGRDFHTVSQTVIEANPKETSILSDNNKTKEVSSNISNLGSLNFWTYSFTLPKSGTYEMISDSLQGETQKTYTGNKGINTLKIPVIKSNNLLDSTDLVEIQQNFSQVIQGWQKNNIYLLTVTYNVETTSNVTIAIDEVQRTYNGRLVPDDLNSTLFTNTVSLTSPGLYTYQALVKSDINARSAKITINQLSGMVTFKSLSLEKVTPQKVFFVQLKEGKSNTPHIVSHQVNLTKYLVEVKNAKAPYYLVFSDSYNTGWKAYIDSCTKACFPFHEWFLESVPEDQHIMANGFSNAWNITSSDSKGKTSYKILVEYWPQRLFLIGLFISCLTLILAIVVYLLHKSKIIRNKEELFD